jgi:peptide/nickel transport system substrate-binding protein
MPSSRAVLPALLALSLAVPALAQPAPTPKRGGTLEFAVDSEPPNYDCHANVSFAFIHPVAPHYSTLLKFDGAYYPEVKGDLAESWTVSPDKKVYTFKLRPNVLFHDGSKMTSADVKASYERIVHPPEGVVSARQVNYAAISAIETPDPLTVVFRLEWPEAAALANFASPWNCIYSAAKLKQDPKFPEKNILGTGAFTFVEHKPKSHWSGKRFDKYFLPGRPYLDGYKANFMSGADAVKAIRDGKVLAEFRSVTPQQRDELQAAMGDKLVADDTPWLLNLMIVFNTRKAPWNDAKVRRALSLAIDRWGAADGLASSTYMKFVGGVLRPGFAMATPESELATLPGFGKDIAKSREEAKRLLAEAGVKDLSFKLTNRNIQMPYGPGGDYAIASWKEIGVTATQEPLDTKRWTEALSSGNFDVGIDFVGDYFDDPTLQLTKYVSTELSPVNWSGSKDTFLDALYVGQAVTTDLGKRTKIVREFEKKAMTEAYSVPLLWWNRIVAHSAAVQGWNITPSHYIEQDLTEVWITNGAAPPSRKAQ